MHVDQCDIGAREPARIHHNSDWSGEAIVEWFAEQRHEVRLPGKVLVGVAAAVDAVRRTIVDALEQLETSPERADEVERHQVSLSWRDVLNCKVWVGHIQKMTDDARRLGYRYFIWNGRVYEVFGDHAAATTMTAKDVR